MQRFASSRWLVLGLVVGVSSSLAATASAIDPKILTELYHQGLKSFYAGDNKQAHDLLTQAIEAGGNDPRYYYFRGIANLRLNRDANAKLDFAKGAELESHDVSSFYNVSTALARVQGADRRTLEEYRGAGRKEAVAAMEKLRFDKFRRFNAEEAIASGATPTLPATPSGGATTPAAGGANPFGAPTTPAANPFGAPATMPDAAPTPPASGSNPFGGSAPAAMPAAAPATPAPAPSNNPFGVPAPGAAPAPATPGTNPFGT